MNQVSLGILVSVASIQLIDGNHYSRAGNKKLRELLASRHDKEIGERWLQENKLKLTILGFVRRKIIRQRQPDKTIKSRNTLLSVTVKGFKELRRRGYKQFGKLLNPMLAWLRRDDHRFPGPSDILATEETMERSAALALLQELIKDIGRGPVGGGDPAAT